MLAARFTCRATLFIIPSCRSSSTLMIRICQAFGILQRCRRVGAALAAQWHVFEDKKTLAAFFPILPPIASQVRRFCQLRQMKFFSRSVSRWCPMVIARLLRTGHMLSAASMDIVNGYQHQGRWAGLANKE